MNWKNTSVRDFIIDTYLLLKHGNYICARKFRGTNRPNSSCMFFMYFEAKDARIIFTAWCLSKFYYNILRNFQAFSNFLWA